MRRAGGGNIGSRAGGEGGEEELPTNDVLSECFDRVTDSHEASYEALCEMYISSYESVKKKAQRGEGGRRTRGVDSTRWYGGTPVEGLGDGGDFDRHITVESVRHISMPSTGGATVDVLPLLPPHLREIYATGDSLIGRPTSGARSCDLVEGEEARILLLARQWRASMIRFGREDEVPTDQRGRPLYNGQFLVEKERPVGRLITDLQRSNDGLGAAPDPGLPTPEDLVRRLRYLASVRALGTDWVIYKRDVSDFFHRLAAPRWWVRHQALFPLSPRVLAGLADIGVDVSGGNVPFVLSVAMGNSHSVTVAQSVMLTLVDRALARLAPRDRQSIQVFTYIDDVSTIGSPRASRIFISFLEEEIAAVGLAIKTSKNVDGATTAEIMGVEVDTLQWTVGASSERMHGLWLDAISLFSHPYSRRDVMSILGKLNWLFLARRALFSSLDVVYRWVHFTHDIDAIDILSGAAAGELFEALILLPLSVSWIAAPRWGTTVTDASMFGGGASVSGSVPVLRSPAQLGKAPTAVGAPPPVVASPPDDGYFWGWFTGDWDATISRRELAALYTGVMATTRRAQPPVHKVIVAFCDNMGVVGAIQKGRSRNPVINRDMKRNAAWMLLRGIYTEVYYIPTGVNPADIYSRGGWGWCNQ